MLSRPRTVLYWTELTSGGKTEVVRVLGSLSEVGRRCHARERPEVAVEVGLVEVPAGQRDRGPIGGRLSGDETQYGLESADATEPLRRQSDMVAKDLDEPSRAEPDRVADLSDRL